jgi:hypothetical protein
MVRTRLTLLRRIHANLGRPLPRVNLALSLEPDVSAIERDLPLLKALIYFSVCRRRMHVGCHSGMGLLVYISEG